jgi:hypothetical protein
MECVRITHRYNDYRTNRRHGGRLGIGQLYDRKIAQSARLYHWCRIRRYSRNRDPAAVDSTHCYFTQKTQTHIKMTASRHFFMLFIGHQLRDFRLQQLISLMCIIDVDHGLFHRTQTVFLIIDDTGNGLII